ncbi:eukaryotic aspartyl protease family protein [Medicago truncatula]|uniref:Eukaryotic aspartyl protease family protein n=1 Tax=Medicago truncatula TaxID=3880 RepID=G7I754_MEDTR|nr:eukaryotic aspartyl protease family protein [Medicago truncatula]
MQCWITDTYMTFADMATGLIRETKKHTTSKTPKSNHNKSKSSSSNIQIFSKSYGGYSINLKFGTPPQTLSFVLDTCSSLVWSPSSSQQNESRERLKSMSTTHSSTRKMEEEMKVVQLKPWKCHRGSIMGDECIDVDVQDIIQHNNRNQNEDCYHEDCNSRGVEDLSFHFVIIGYKKLQFGMVYVLTLREEEERKIIEEKEGNSGF